MDVSVTISFFIATVLTILYLIAKWKNNFWVKRKVPHVKPLPIAGNYAEYLLMKKSPGIVVQELCQRFPNEPLIGSFYGTDPALIVQDPEMLKLVFTKDFYYFNGRENNKYIHSEIMTKSLFFTYGDEWKVVRQNLTPIFSSSKIKNMFYLIQDCTKSLVNMVERESGTTQVVDVSNLMARYTMDCVSTCAFGVQANTMEIKNNNAFQMMAMEIFKPTTWDGYKLILRMMWPGLFYLLRLQWFPKLMSDFFDELLKDVFAARGGKPSNRNDFVDLILTFKKGTYLIGDSISGGENGVNGRIRMEVTDEFLVSQCMLFFTAGFETSSLLLSYSLYELAKNKEAQKRVHEEVDEYFRRQNGKIEYNCVTELPYLDACLQETSRLYPVLGLLTREVVADYTFPTGLTVEKGMRIHIPVFHLHRNPQYFPEPDKFIPERFLPGAVNEIKKYTFIPFGEGPRMCIGMRFSKMQTLAGLATFIKNYGVELAEGTPTKLDFDPRVYPTRANCDLKLKIIKRE